jgi:hypothetical protein
MESNHPSVGLPRPAGFEDKRCGAKFSLYRLSFSHQGGG